MDPRAVRSSEGRRRLQLGIGLDDIAQPLLVAAVVFPALTVGAAWADAHCAWWLPAGGSAAGSMGRWIEVVLLPLAAHAATFVFLSAALVSVGLLILIAALCCFAEITRRAA